jgi:hypothetical protein
MAFVPIPGTIRAVMRFQQFSDERQMVTHWHKDSGSVTTGDLTTVANALAAWWAGVGSGPSTNQLALFDIVCTDISVPNGAQFNSPVQPPDPGNIVDVSSPGNVTSTLSWRTAKTGRRYRGRTYWPGFAEGSTNDDGTVNGAQLLRLAAAGAALLFGSNPVGFHLAVASKVAAAAEVVTAVVTENVLDSMRRRLPKRGI